jgi:hypothetical protein
MSALPWIKTTHRVSAVLLIAFAALHLINHGAGFWGVAAHQAFMDGARVVYRSPFGEAILFVAIGAQVVTGLFQFWVGRGARRSFWPRLQAYSGLYLGFYLVNHTLSVLSARIFYDLDSNFYLAAAVLTIAPLPIFFAPYYGLGIFALFAHIACAIRARLGAQAGDDAAKALLALGAVAAPAIVAIFMGAFYDIQLPAAYRALVDQFL